MRLLGWVESPWTIDYYKFYANSSFVDNDFNIFRNSVRQAVLCPKSNYIYLASISSGVFIHVSRSNMNQGPRTSSCLLASQWFAVCSQPRFCDQEGTSFFVHRGWCKAWADWSASWIQRSLCRIGGDRNSSIVWVSSVHSRMAVLANRGCRWRYESVYYARVI